MTRFFTGLAALAVLCTAHAQANEYSLLSGVAPTDPYVTPSGVAEGGAAIYTNQSDFEAAAAAQGKQLKFIEDFEEATTPAGAIGSSFPAPLEPGVAAGDFPNGLAANNIRINCEDTSGNGFCDLLTLGANFSPRPTKYRFGPEQVCRYADH